MTFAITDWVNEQLHPWVSISAELGVPELSKFTAGSAGLTLFIYLFIYLFIANLCGIHTIWLLRRSVIHCVP